MPRLPRLAVLVCVVLVAGTLAVAVFRGRHVASVGVPSAAPLRPPEEKCDDRGWCDQTPKGVGTVADTFTGTWAVGPNDVWAAGLTGSAWHWDGVQWVGRPSGAKILRGVFALGPNLVWLVGGHSAIEWDGTKLTTYAMPVPGGLHAVYGRASDDVWAVSEGGATAHWDGHAWTKVEAPFHGWLQAIWGSGAGDYWAAGGAPQGEAGDVILHWDGQRWSAEHLPRSCSIEGLSGTARDDVWAVGSWGTILHYDGHGWRESVSPATRGLNGVWARSRDDVWVVGENGLVLHWDGAVWSATRPGWRWLRSVTGTSLHEAWAAGEDGWILHWHGESVRLNPPLATGTGSAERPSAAATPEPEPAPTSAPVSAALARGRKLFAEGRGDEAIAEFTRAIPSGQDVNRRALVELAYAQLRRDAGTDEAVEAELLAGATDADAEVEAQAWYNLALLYARQGRNEPERAALARSLARREHPSVRAKLNGRSRCVAELGASTAIAPELVRGWPGVCVSLGRCREGEKVSAAEARKRSCLTCSMSAQDPDESHGCDGDGPWRSSFDYQMYSLTDAWIAPAGNNRFFVAVHREGSWPAICRGSFHQEWEQTKDYAKVTLTGADLSDVPGRPIPQGDPESGLCMSGPDETITGVFALKTGKPLAIVATAGESSVEVTLDEQEKRLVLSGGGCDGYMPLDGTMRLMR